MPDHLGRRPDNEPPILGCQAPPPIRCQPCLRPLHGTRARGSKPASSHRPGGGQSPPLLEGLTTRNSGRFVAPSGKHPRGSAFRTGSRNCQRPAEGSKRCNQANNPPFQSRKGLGGKKTFSPDQSANTAAATEISSPVRPTPGRTGRRPKTTQPNHTNPHTQI